jgi:FtsP/CotA-like multicopper oxidase with cupredoxin domain
MELSRRDLLKIGALSGAALYLPMERLARAKDFRSLARLPRPFTYPFVRPADIDLRGGGSLDMRMRQVSAPLLGPAPTWPQTPLWAYTGPQGQINPTIHVEKGRPVEITHYNDLPATHPIHGYESWTSVHLHGSASLPQHDGYASDVIKPGQRKVYKYPNQQGARTLWYHDHGVHRTAKNAYAGLAGQYHMHDEMERASGIPTGDYDIPLTIRDALFEQSGVLMWDDNDQSGFMGDVILVNGVPWPVLPVTKRRYRFRILNASISRSFNLSLSDSRAKVWVIATDGGFMPKPVQVSSIKVGMAERYEVIVDFSDCLDNAAITLKSGEVKNNIDYQETGKVMQFKVLPGVKLPTDQPGNIIPTSFYTPIAPRSGSNYTGPDEVMGLTEAMAVKRRLITFKKSDVTGMWLINGETWDDVVASDYRRVIADPAANSIEVWDFENKSGGWFHPVHVHLVDFKILKRNGSGPRNYEVGPKDVVYVGEGETVRVVAKFGPHEGKYMIHCHNLVHEDHDMMSQFRVGPEKENDPNDPIKAAPAF